MSHLLHGPSATKRDRCNKRVQQYLESLGLVPMLCDLMDVRVIVYQNLAV